MSPIKLDRWGKPVAIKKARKKPKNPPGAKKPNKGTPRSEKKRDLRTIHLMEASMQFDDSIEMLERDLRFVMAQGADVVGFTEITSPEWKKRLREVAQELGYRPVILPHNIQFVVKLGGPNDLKVKGQGEVKAAEGVTGRINGRYLAWVRISWAGQDIFVHCAHWSRMRLGEGRHEDVTNAMARSVKKHGQGARISFFMGDLNIHEGADNRNNDKNMPNYIFRENGLLSIWDEFSVVPAPTLGGAVFDVIGSYRPDTQVKGERYLVHPKQHSDHSFVSAWYSIDVSTKVTSGAGTNGGPVGSTGNPDATEDDAATPDPDFYATGGNIDWSDYLDDDVYELPYAFGDSDSHRHG